MDREVIEQDFRKEEFIGRDPKDYEFRRGDDKVVRKDRWEQGIHSIRRALGDNRREFEISDIVKAVECLVCNIEEQED